MRMFWYIRKSILLACIGVAAITTAQAENSSPAGPCAAPDFLLNGQCWTELADDEDCRVEPIIMELEDQPVYCPRDSILHAQQQTQK